MWKRRTAATEAGEGLARIERDYARLFAELETTQRRYESLARAVWRVQEEERRHLARELHDELGQLLTALIHRLDRSAVGDRHSEVELAREALGRVRELARLLRPPVLDDLGLAAALNWLGRQTRECTGLEVAVSTPAVLARVDPDIETLVYRVAQEGLTNAVRHAGGQHATIVLERLGTQLELRVRDDGCGFDPERLRQDGNEGTGLGGMRDRVALFGGTLAIRSAPGSGTEIVATLALPPAATGNGSAS